MRPPPREPFDEERPRHRHYRQPRVRRLRPRRAIPRPGPHRDPPAPGDRPPSGLRRPDPSRRREPRGILDRAETAGHLHQPGAGHPPARRAAARRRLAPESVPLRLRGRRLRPPPRRAARRSLGAGTGIPRGHVPRLGGRSEEGRGAGRPHLAAPLRHDPRSVRRLPRPDAAAPEARPLLRPGRPRGPLRVDQPRGCGAHDRVRDDARDGERRAQRRRPRPRDAGCVRPRGRGAGGPAGPRTTAGGIPPREPRRARRRDRRRPGRRARQGAAGGLRPRPPDPAVLELLAGPARDGPCSGESLMNRFVLPGAAVCAALAIVSAMGVGPLGLLELLFLLAAWVIVPIGLRFLPDVGPIRLARRIQPAAAVLATISFFLPTGIAAAALAAPWTILNGLVALGGLMTVREAFKGGIPSLLLLAAMMMPPVGGVHLVSSRLGHPMAGFPEPIILLTAVHFHYTAFAAPILASLTARTGPWAGLAKAAGVGLVGGTPLLAAGFLFSPVLKSA